MSTAFITHADYLKHNMGDGHPECPARLTAIDDQLIASGLKAQLDVHQASSVTQAQLERVHFSRYVEVIKNSAPERGIVHLDPDTAMNSYTLNAALLAAGAGVIATDLVIDGKNENAFCSVRPPGHHAMRSRAMGFCFFNNVAVAAAHALEHHGLQRVTIVDFDVHHGNGTEDIFSDDPRVLMVSIFQHPFYPYSGTDDPAPNMVNIPLPAGSGGAALHDAVTKHWLPALDDFKPEMIFFSAGFDAHREDDMARLEFVEADYAWVTQEMKKVAEKYASNRIVSLLEGGYALSALGRSVAAHLKVLSEE